MGRRSLHPVKSSMLFDCHYAARPVFAGAFAAHSHMTAEAGITASTHKESDGGLRVKCKQCRRMISADMNAIEAHSSECLPIKCRRCGEFIVADGDSIEDSMLAHASVCLR